jgi:branched-chain amino acid transport system substrate-binding protein
MAMGGKAGACRDCVAAGIAGFREKAKMKILQKWLWLTALCAALAATSTAQAQEPIKIGFLFVENGSMAQLGADMREGFKMYWDEVGNKAGGRPVQIIYESENTTKPDESLTKARKLVERDNVNILTGITNTPTAYALRPYLVEKKMPSLVLLAGADGLTQDAKSEYIFRSGFTNSHGSPPLAEWAIKQGYRKAVILATDYGAGIENIGGFARTFQKMGGQIIQEMYAPFGSDFAPYITKIRRDADVVAVVFFGSDAVRFVKQYEEYGLKGKIPLIAKGGLTDEALLAQEGDAALGIVSSFHWSAALDTPENAKFKNDFSANFKRPASFSAESGYAGGKILHDAIEAIKGKVENKEDLLAAVRHTDIKAPRGNIKFDSYQNSVHNYYIMKVEKKDGQYQNTVIDTSKNVSQFGTLTPEAYLAQTPLANTKGTWEKP